MDRIDLIREEERKYHESFYSSSKLFEEGTWLHKPVEVVVNWIEKVDKHDPMTVLDLGCGVGRNAIPIAQAICRVKGSGIGTKSQGINCIIANTSVQEFDAVSGQQLEPFVEINLTVAEMRSKLRTAYEDWEELLETVKSLSFQINRGNQDVLLKTDALTFVVRRPSFLTP